MDYRRVKFVKKSSSRLDSGSMLLAPSSAASNPIMFSHDIGDPSMQLAQGALTSLNLNTIPLAQEISPSNAASQRALQHQGSFNASRPAYTSAQARPIANPNTSASLSGRADSSLSSNNNTGSNTSLVTQANPMLTARGSKTQSQSGMTQLVARESSQSSLDATATGKDRSNGKFKHPALKRNSPTSVAGKTLIVPNPVPSVPPSYYGGPEQAQFPAESDSALVSALYSSPFSEEILSQSSSASGQNLFSESLTFLSRGTSWSSSRSQNSSKSGLSGDKKKVSLKRSVSWRFRTAKRDSAGRVARSDDEWKSILSHSEYKILREKYMEPPYTGRYVQFSLPPSGETGLFLCRGCGETVFMPDQVKQSVTGWVTFGEGISRAARVEQNIRGGMTIGECFCTSCGGFLGICDRGDYLINSTVLEFIIPNLPSKAVFMNDGNMVTGVIPAAAKGKS